MSLSRLAFNNLTPFFKFGQSALYSTSMFNMSRSYHIVIGSNKNIKKNLVTDPNGTSFENNSNSDPENESNGSSKKNFKKIFKYGGIFSISGFVGYAFIKTQDEIERIKLEKERSDRNLNLLQSTLLEERQKAKRREEEMEREKYALQRTLREERDQASKEKEKLRREIRLEQEEGNKLKREKIREEEKIMEQFRSDVQKNNIEAVRRFIGNKESSDLNKKIWNNYSDYALIDAIYNNHYEMVKLLLDNNAPIQSGVFDMAVRKGSNEIIKMLIDKYSPTINDIFSVISNENNDILKTLIESGKINLMERISGKTVIEHAINHNNCEAIKMLFAAESKFLNSKCSGGENPLFYSMRRASNSYYAEKPTLIVANIYLDKRDELKDFNINDTTDRGHGILHYLLTFGSKSDDIFERIIKEFKPNLDMRDSDETPILMHAIGKGIFFDCSIPKIKSMIENGADINITDKDGNTPLLYAISKSKFDVVKLLLNSNKICLKCDGMMIKIIDGLSKSNYYDNGKKEIYEILIKTKINVNDRIDNYDETLLMKAARKGDTCLLKLLLDNGADVGLVNKDNKTALDIAEMNKQTKCVDLIKSFEKEKENKMEEIKEENKEENKEDEKETEKNNSSWCWFW